jgi:hypothetical protein
MYETYAAFRCPVLRGRSALAAASVRSGHAGLDQAGATGGCDHVGGVRAIGALQGVRPAATRCSSPPESMLRRVDDQSFSPRVDRQGFIGAGAFTADRHATAPRGG